MAKRKTLEQFIEDANIVHDCFYTYEHFIYINNDTKSWITCPIHGDFLQDPRHHLRGHGCPLCKSNIKLTLKDFINRANKIHNNCYDYSLVNYINNYTKVKIICKKCGNIFEQTPKDHLRGHGCSKCGNDKIKKC